jgi:hypothetical protein
MSSSSDKQVSILIADDLTIFSPTPQSSLTVHCNSDTVLPFPTAALLPAYWSGVFPGQTLKCWVETEGFSCFYQNLQVKSEATDEALHSCPV